MEQDSSLKQKEIPMVIRREEMQKDQRNNMRGGEGTIDLLHFDKKENMRNCRLLSQITIPAGGSIGEHRHDNETEYFIILDGEGMVNDNGHQTAIHSGDVLKTGEGASHSIRNTGDTPLSMLAIIITN